MLMMSRRPFYKMSRFGRMNKLRWEHTKNIICCTFLLVQIKNAHLQTYSYLRKAG